MEIAHRLVERARGGDVEAFGELVKMYHDRVYGLLCGMVRNADDARDLAQQAWVKGWTRLKGYHGGSEFFTWMYRIAANTALDFLRRKARLRENVLPNGVEPAADVSVERAPSETSRPDREAQRAEVRRMFDEALGTLSPEHRLTLTLREVQGLSYDEIADVMKCRRGTVMSRLFYARRKMQECMKELL
jgi:RNA polymerase sigma-70 factor (ECF subfamily)